MSTNIIKMYRGDNYSFNLTIDDGIDNDQDYSLIGDDAVYFALMEPNAPFECPLMAIKLQRPLEDGTQRVFPEGYGVVTVNDDESTDVAITLPTGATTNLLPGVYYYSVKLDINHADPDDANTTVKKTITIINKTKFIILD